MPLRAIPPLQIAAPAHVSCIRLTPRRRAGPRAGGGLLFRRKRARSSKPAANPASAF